MIGAETVSVYGSLFTAYRSSLVRTSGVQYRTKQTSMAATDPNDTKTHIVTNSNSLQQFGFKGMLDGTPSFYFEKEFAKPFKNSLGRIVMDGASLKDKLEGNSPANPSGRHHFVPNAMVNGAQLPLGQVNGVPQQRATHDMGRQEGNHSIGFWVLALM